jgi:CheY-like chemotaxis protein
MNVVLFSRDLMLLARTQGAANKTGATLLNATSDEQTLNWGTVANCCGIVIDLRTPGLKIDELVSAIRETRGSEFPIVACGPHVQDAALNAAREAGCSLVATRGQFERDAEVILASFTS